MCWHHAGTGYRAAEEKFPRKLGRSEAVRLRNRFSFAPCMGGIMMMRRDQQQRSTKVDIVVITVDIDIIMTVRRHHDRQ